MKCRGGDDKDGVGRIRGEYDEGAMVWRTSDAEV